MFFTKPWLKSLSGLFLNLSATWFAALFITPAITPSSNLFWLLTRYLSSAILCLLLSVKIEELLEKL